MYVGQVAAYVQSREATERGAGSGPYGAAKPHEAARNNERLPHKLPIAYTAEAAYHICPADEPLFFR